MPRPERVRRQRASTWSDFVHDLIRIGFTPADVVTEHAVREDTVILLPGTSIGRVGTSRPVDILEALGGFAPGGTLDYFDADTILLRITTTGMPFHLRLMTARSAIHPSSVEDMKTWRQLRNSADFATLGVGMILGAPAAVLAGVGALLPRWKVWSPPPKVAPKPRRGHVYTLAPGRKGGIDIVGVKIPKLDNIVPLGAAFDAHDAEVRGRIRSGTKGLILLHGAPGSGKTTYIRQLIHTCDELGKRIILVPRTLIELLSGPALVTLLPKLAKVPSVLVIEDAEPLMERQRTDGTSVLLNLTDGLLNDVAKTQVVATFNCPIDDIDPALLRAGRLLARWEFGPLSVEDGRAAAERLGLDPGVVTRPMTIAEIAAARPLIVSLRAARGPMGMH